MMYASQLIMLYTLHSCSAVCQLYLKQKKHKQTKQSKSGIIKSHQVNLGKTFWGTS